MFFRKNKPCKAYLIRSLEEVSLHTPVDTYFDSRSSKSTHSYVRVIVGKKGSRNVNGKSESVSLWKSPEYHQVYDLILVPDFHDRKGDYWLAFNAIGFQGKKLVQIGDDIIYGKTLAEVAEENKYDGEPDDSDNLVMHIATG
ncbi:MAG: hypothetical protein AABW91_02160 [Nanoarchaeota archaeon]